MYEPVKTGPVLRVRGGWGAFELYLDQEGFLENTKFHGRGEKTCADREKMSLDEKKRHRFSIGMVVIMQRASNSGQQSRRVSGD
ncbi:unnamed protein product [Fusarium graminearum]|uniref:Uncharacterized protein n=1 Tax=Gibberella zeae TaxID=5518 RepID=A0A4U9F609_GIBZA|nr:unnamed protein product [Fusarium graminearum]CAF3532426.1 unnamed protein product [Fusarium graminearum]CAF3655624.1 unnamed protein product [Fusarium graminearum]CAG1992431.1 unnamed protein product [Fusarium graminearum]CAG2006239.1 unnamed protein product [Fusarium graminearum]